jgi:hypothetical protein
MIIESGLVKAGLVKAGLVRAISNINTRYFRRNEGTTDYATIPEVTLAGDFAIEFDVLSDNDDNAYMILGNNGGTQNCIFITNNDISVRDNSGSTVFSNGDYLQPQEFHHVKIIKASSVVEIFIDGVSRGGGASSSSYIFNMLYTRQSGVFILPGILANLKIWDNGTPIRDYKLNDNSDILANSATVLGEEEVVNGDFSNASNWALGDGWSISNGSAHCDGSQAGDTVLSQVINAPTGAYLIEIDLGSISSGDIKSVFFGGVKFNSSGITSTGKSRFVGLTANSDDLAIIGNSAFSGSVDNISIRQADGYGTVINGNAEDWGLFTEQAVFWKGKDLAVPPWDSVDQELPKA